MAVNVQRCLDTVLPASRFEEITINPQCPSIRHSSPEVPEPPIIADDPRATAPTQGAMLNSQTPC